MAGPRTRRNAGGAPTNNNGIPVPTLAVSRAPTLTPASVLSPPEKYTAEDLQRATKLALESFVKG